MPLKHDEEVKAMVANTLENCEKRGWNKVCDKHREFIHDLQDETDFDVTSYVTQKPLPDELKSDEVSFGKTRQD